MLDLHCHILPALDDGPTCLEESLFLARFAVRDGITHIIATPHCFRDLRTLRADVLPRVARLNADLTQAGVPLTVLPGSEIQAFDSALYRREEERGLYCHLGGGHAFTLLEPPWHEAHCPPDLPELIDWLVRRGLTPIVAHPERIYYLRDDPARLKALTDAGGWLQLTVDSLLGNFGPRARSAAEEMLDGYQDVVLATDAHGPHRCSGLSKGYEWVARRFGPQRADDLKARADHVLRRLLADGVPAA
jgi:protein-tyrosine phosphatase